MKARMLVIAFGIACAAGVQPAAAQTAEQQPAVSPPQCDSVSFAQGTAANRAACRRVYAHDVYGNRTNVPHWAVDYEW
ncbi:hypothetical protein KDW49_17125 [Burkholderia dolosa]|uniref:hypothetical protein n=1 Tax=Burkholderia dolosa TaxID=152500 RepID=UPI001B9C0EE3|nr:hypothetical protein [Burkholderia dolosa]MBR8302431.1 hypothetical protein [Burkholderia dolosa]